MRTCISPDQGFIYGIHKPSYSVRNLRSRTQIEKLGCNPDGSDVINTSNYPENRVKVEQANWIYEIANPFPFRGTTYIGKTWADRNAENPDRIKLQEKPAVSLHQALKSQHIDPGLLEVLPRPLLLSLATTSTDRDDLIRLAETCCSFENDEKGIPTGLRYQEMPDGKCRPEISDFDLFEAVANNPVLPDSYKIAMVIRPGAQGISEIVGDFHQSQSTHVYEYLRRNSYIGGGHYAANMADDSIRYQIKNLSVSDIKGLRHLYYQRSYVRLAEFLHIEIGALPFSDDALEDLRSIICGHPEYKISDMAATLWGWNFGFDFASSGYRLHASHQQIHQQYSMIPSQVEAFAEGFSDSIGEITPFSSGDMIHEVIETYRLQYNRSFFHDYFQAIENNNRMDGRDDRSDDLVVWQNERVLLFVPKAQTSQWELQIITKPDENGDFAGNIVECETALRTSLDIAILKAQQALEARGATMVTTIEYSKRFSSLEKHHPLIYCFMPKLPHSPGAFSETQLRFINGHYPEDFAEACRHSLAQYETNIR